MFILVFGLTFLTLTTNFIIAGKYYPTGMAMITALQVWLACLPFIGLSFLVNSYFHNTLKSLIVILIVIFIACWVKFPLYLLNYTFAYPFVEKLHAFSWIDFITIIILTISTFGLAVWNFNRNEY